MSDPSSNKEKRGFNIGDPEAWHRHWLEMQRQTVRELRAEADYLEDATDRGIAIRPEVKQMTQEEALMLWAEEDGKRGRKVYLASRRGGLIHSEMQRAKTAARNAEIRKAVTSGDAVKPGGRKPTQKEIAKRFRVSASTVSRIAKT
ncbi:MAG: hypothetical protein V4558_03920 [Gemmatimonadota bacterium]